MRLNNRQRRALRRLQNAEYFITPLDRELAKQLVRKGLVEIDTVLDPWERREWNKVIARLPQVRLLPHARHGNYEG